MFNKVRSVIYKVNDLAKAKEWYIKATGIHPYFDESFYVGFDINGFELGLDPDMADVIEGNQSIAYWSVDNIEESVNKLIEMGGVLASPITNVGGPTFVAVVQDIFGNNIGLIAGA